MCNRIVKAKLIRTFFLTVFISLSFQVIGQTGKIEGTITDSKSGETLPGATVTVVGTNLGAIADFDGHYSIANIKPGKYNVQISFISYNPVIFENVTVEANQSTQLNTTLAEVSITLNNVEVVAVKRGGSELSMISAIKTSNLVVSGISSQQISKTQDRDASEVVKRIPGISIIDDKFIVVRGLNQRYNSVWLNNSPAPSSEADTRAFSFDVIPSSMIENLSVYKSPAPELSADFAGGYVGIATKNMPDKNFVSFSYGISYNEGTTFKNHYHEKRGGLDWLGFDDGTRALPESFPSKIDRLRLDENTLVNLGKKTNKSWDPVKSTAIPDQSASLAIGKTFSVKKIRIGNITAINYRYSSDFNFVKRSSYNAYDVSTSESSPKYIYNDSAYESTTKVSLLHNWAMYFTNGKIEFRNLFNQIGKASTLMREGTEYYTVRDIRLLEHHFTSRSTYAGQLAGENSFNERNTKIDYLLGYTFSNRLEPAQRRLASVKDPNTGIYSANILTTVNPDYGGLFYGELSENIISAKMNFQHTFDNGKGFKPQIKLGGYYENKHRDFSIRLLGYVLPPDRDPSLTKILPFDAMLSDENINSNGFELGEVTRPSDSYEAGNDIYSGYVAGNIPFGKFNLYTGIRLEHNIRVLKTKLPTGTLDKTNKYFDLFPSANLSYNFNEKNVIRLAYGKTINRPEFRELAPFSFFNFEDNATIVGNPDLKNSYIQNIDLRFEHYPSPSETYSFAIFYKNFKDPIELYDAAGSSGKIYTFDNAEAANNVGIEGEIRKSLDFISSLKNFSLVLNAAYINSKVVFPDSLKDLNRPLWGQSPYLLNVGLFYSGSDNGWSASAQYNVFGSRLRVIGKPKQEVINSIPNEYEMPRHLLDLTLSKKFRIVEFRAGIRNILDSPVLFNQTVEDNEGSKVKTYETRKYYFGRTYNLTVSFSF